MIIRIAPSEPFDLTLTTISHGWVNLSPFHWNNSAKFLRWCLQVHDCTVNVEVTQPNPDELLVRFDRSSAPSWQDDMMRSVE